MRINITDQIISEFFSGALIVLVLVAMGSLLLILLKGVSKTFPFTRMGATIALAPLSMINFLDEQAGTMLIYYAMTAALLGIAIDGINHLITPKERIKVEEEKPMKQETEEIETRPGVIVWEKAE